MPEKLLIFGGNGFVGGHIIRNALYKGWKVYCADKYPKFENDSIEHIEADITRRDKIAKIFKTVNPNVAINVAAVSDIDFAQNNPEIAYEINVTGAANIAHCCCETSHPVKYIFFSSDAVYKGDKDRFFEEDLPDPVNYYGETKAEAEKKVVDIYPLGVIVRISLVLGFPVTEGNSFLASLYTKLMEGKAIGCPEDEYRTPVDVHTLSECIIELAKNDFSGTINIGSTDSINRYELTKKAVQLMGLEESLVIPKNTTVNDPSRAPRHKNGIISVEKAKSILKTRLLSAEESIVKACESR